MTTAPDPLKAYETSLLIKTLMAAVTKRDEIMQFARDLFAEVNLEVLEEEHYDAFYSPLALLSPAGSGGSRVSPRKSMMVQPGVPLQEESESVANLETAVKESAKIWNKLKEYAELVPVTLRYFCKMVIEILRKKCGPNLTEQKERAIIADAIIMNMLMPALNDPIGYDIVMDCVVSDSYMRVSANVAKILNAIMLGYSFPKQDPLGMYANKLIESSQ